jgi:hypothetical protein
MELTGDWLNLRNEVRNTVCLFLNDSLKKVKRRNLRYIGEIPGSEKMRNRYKTLVRKNEEKKIFERQKN